MRKLTYFLIGCLFLTFMAVGSDSYAGTVRVKGYYRKDGTYVQPHTRTAPDGIKWNNKSNW